MSRSSFIEKLFTQDRKMTCLTAKNSWDRIIIQFWDNCCHMLLSTTTINILYGSVQTLYHIFYHAGKAIINKYLLIIIDKHKLQRSCYPFKNQQTGTGLNTPYTVSDIHTYVYLYFNSIHFELDLQISEKRKQNQRETRNRLLHYICISK